MVEHHCEEDKAIPHSTEWRNNRDLSCTLLSDASAVIRMIQRKVGV